MSVLDYVMGMKNTGSGGGGGLVVTWNTSTLELDKTWQEIHDAMAAGRYVIIAHNDAEVEEHIICTSCVCTGTEYLIHAFAWHGEEFAPSIFCSETANDYPVYD